MSLYLKAIMVVDSCNTPEQAKVANEYLILAMSIGLSYTDYSALWSRLMERVGPPRLCPPPPPPLSNYVAINNNREIIESVSHLGCSGSFFNGE